MGGDDATILLRGISDPARPLYQATVVDPWTTLQVRRNEWEAVAVGPVRMPVVWRNAPPPEIATVVDEDGCRETYYDGIPASEYGAPVATRLRQAAMNDLGVVVEGADLRGTLPTFVTIRPDAEPCRIDAVVALCVRTLGELPDVRAHFERMWSFMLSFMADRAGWDPWTSPVMREEQDAVVLAHKTPISPDLWLPIEVFAGGEAVDGVAKLVRPLGDGTFGAVLHLFHRPRGQLSGARLRRTACWTEVPLHVTPESMAAAPVRQVSAELGTVVTASAC